MGYWSKSGAYVYDENDDNVAMGMVEKKRTEEAPKKAIINSILTNFPSNSNELIVLLESLDYRLDFMKDLLEESRNKFFATAKKYKDDFSPAANEAVNNSLQEYMCLIETLKSTGKYNFGREMDSYNRNYQYYDPDKPELMLSEAMNMMHIRRKKGADIDIIFPMNYDLENQENMQKTDAITIINGVDHHIKNNRYISTIWKKAGYEEPTYSSNKTM